MKGSRSLTTRYLHLVGLTVFLLAAVPAAAQTGGIEVTVTTATDGSPLPGVTVVLSSDQGLVKTTSVLTDAKGRASFPVLRAGGGYLVEVTMPGFSSQRRADIRVRSASSETLSFSLTPPVEERVEVVATGSVVDLEQVGARTRFSDQFIDDLPIPGRFYQNVLTLAPGFTDSNGDGNPNVHGARERNFRAEVSGVSNVDPLTGQWLSRVNPDSIEELEIIPQGAGVEFGRAQGGFTRVIQKQGTNEFEGVFNFLYRSSLLDGEGAGNFSPIIGPPSFETVQPSIQLSGPIIKDKLWFRLSHEYIKNELPVDLLTGTAVTTREQSINADQITWQVSPRNKLAFQYQNDPLTLDGLGLSTSVPLESTRTLETGGPTYSVAWTAPMTPKLLIESLAAYQDHTQDVIPTTTGVEQECAGFEFLPAMHNARCLALATNRTSGSHFETSLDQRQRLTVRSQATLYRRWGSHSHQIKTGFVVENERYFRDLNRLPDITLSVIDNPLGVPQGIASVQIAIPQTTTARATANNWALYAEDQWKPTGNFTLTFGLRLDREEIDAEGREPFDPEAEASTFLGNIENGGDIPSSIRRAFTSFEDILGFRDELARVFDVSQSLVRLDPVTIQSASWSRVRRAEDIRIENTNWSPRLALAWDPWSNGKTKFSLTAGRYYDKIFLAVPLVELEPIETTITFDTLLLDGQFRNFDRDLSTSPLTANQVDRNLRTPYQDEFSLGFEREIATETVLRLLYLKRAFRDQLQDVDINHQVGDLGRCIEPDFVGDRVVAISEGKGDPILDPYTGEVYIDTNPGFGDGRVDDCTGDVTAIFGTTPQADSPDGKADLYVQNPGWREVFLFGNFNTADYEAFVVEMVRRMYRSWEMQASYTYSTAEGDAEDFDLLLGNEQNLREDERGFLSYDQRHQVKINVTSILPWAFRLGGSIRWESGLPYSELISRLTVFSTPPQYFDQGLRELRPRLRYPSGQRNDQRNESFWTLDVRAAKDFSLGGGVNMQLALDVFNLLNDDALTIAEQVNGINNGQRRFGRQYQVGLRLAF